MFAHLHEKTHMHIFKFENLISWIIVIVVSINYYICFENDRVTWLSKNVNIDVEQKWRSSNGFDVYCFPGKTRKLKYALSTSKIKLKFPATVKPNFMLLKGDNISHLNFQFKSNFKSWYTFLLLLLPKLKIFEKNFDMYKVSCIGVYTKDAYRLNFNFAWMDVNKIIALFICVILLIFAPLISKNPVFYYLFSMVVGNLASFLILLFLVGRLFPQHKNLSYVLMLGGWSASAYLMSYIWYNVQFLAYNYKNMVLAYLGIVSFATFLYCYYKGSPQNPKIFKMFEWSLQMLAIAAIYSLLNYKFMAVIPVALLICNRLICYTKYSPNGIISKYFIAYWNRKFPPKIKFLTEEEYREQGLRETTTELEKLRKYCQSPECVAWKLAQRLHDPSRFAAFVGGSESHVTEDETFTWEHDLTYSKKSADIASYRGVSTKLNRTFESGNGDISSLKMRIPFINRSYQEQPPYRDGKDRSDRWTNSFNSLPQNIRHQNNLNRSAETQPLQNRNEEFYSSDSDSSD